MTSGKELEILNERLNQVKASIRMTSYGFVVSIVGLAYSINIYVNDDKNILPVVVFSTLTAVSAFRGLTNINKEYNIRNEIKKKTLTKIKE